MDVPEPNEPARITFRVGDEVILSVADVDLRLVTIEIQQKMKDPDAWNVEPDDWEELSKGWKLEEDLLSPDWNEPQV